jgi:hypothetical protein
MRRRIATVIARLMTWICYGLVIVTLADHEAVRCYDFGNLAAECTAPLLRFFAGISALFLIATLSLAVLALRSTSSGKSN